MDIKSRVEQLKSQFGTRDPFILAESLGVLILDEPLGSVRGYYGRSHRQKVIHINEALEESLRQFVCAHELGHAVLHPDSNTPFLRANTLFSIDRFEIEANRFAADLLLPDDELREAILCRYTVPQIAAMYGLSPALVEYRVQSLR